MPASDSPNAVVTPGANLTGEGVPPSPLTLVETLRRYTEARAALGADRHPTRREMLLRTRFADTAQVYSIAFPGGDRRQMTFFADTVGGAAYQPRSRAGNKVTITDKQGRILKELVTV